MTHEPRKNAGIASRRTFLKGLPAGLAGLVMVSPLWSRLVSRAMAQETTQRRFIVWYHADGIVPEFFWGSAAGTLTIRSDRTSDLSGKDFNTSVASADRPTFILQPISGYSANTLLIKGISNAGEGDHTPAVRSCLTGDAARGETTGSTPSLDNVVAEVLANDRHAEPVLRTGVYGSRVSYAGTRDLSRPRGRSFVEPSWQPTSDARRVLDAVGGAAPTTPPTPGAPPRSVSRLAVLGAVRERVAALKCAAGSGAATRLEAYLEEVARLERLERDMRPSSPVPSTPSGGPLIDPAAPEFADAQRNITGLATMAPFVRDLAVTALAMEYSPVVTIQWGASGTNNIEGGRLTDSRYDFIPNLEYPGAGDHGLAHPEDGAFQDAGHNISAAVSTRDRVRIFRWYYGQLALLLDRLKSIPDGTGTLFDNTTVLCVSEFGGPNANSTAAQHSPKNLPYVLVGGANSPIRTGQYLSMERSHGDYLLSVARAFGSSESRMGVGSSTIDGIART